jgi:TRAP-type C4-dicarboxylate transport system substrate-binding protein
MPFKKSVSCAVIATFAMGSSAIAGTTWDMPTAYPASNFQTLNAEDFAKCVGAGTGGDLNIVLHANGTLFKGNDIKRAVQTGQAQIGERLLSSHENENALFGTDSIPFLATSYDASVKLYGAARPELDKVLDAQGLMLLYSVPWPPQGLYFNKDVGKVADMSGIKVRSYNKATARLSELTGMVPISIEAAEISQALSAGVISSLITSAVTGQDTKVWESLNHFYEVKAWMPRNTVIVNKGIFDALPDKDKTAIKDCAAKAEVNGLQKSKDADAAAVGTLKKNGMMVAAPSADFSKELQKIGATMTAEWIAKAGDAGKTVIDQFKK